MCMEHELVYQIVRLSYQKYACQKLGHLDQWFGEKPISKNYPKALIAITRLNCRTSNYQR